MAPHVPLQRAIQGIDVVVVVVVEEDDLEVDEELGDGICRNKIMIQRRVQSVFSGSMPSRLGRFCDHKCDQEINEN